jgi:hypothetical protein
LPSLIAFFLQLLDLLKIAKLQIRLRLIRLGGQFVDLGIPFINFGFELLHIDIFFFRHQNPLLAKLRVMRSS